MRTSPVVSFGLYALEVKQDSIPSASGLQPFSKADDLRTGNSANLPFASFEPDFWLLDGGYKFLPSNLATVHIGLMSTAMSDGSGVFVVAPVLTVDFASVHQSDGLTIQFSSYTGDYANVLTVAYYDNAAALIRTDTYAPASTEFSTGVAVTGFKQIVITFYSTNRPYRYLRVQGVDYGTLIYFTGSQIKSASVVEETDMLSSEARFNIFDVTLFSSDAAFSIINPAGYYAYLQERQPIAVHEIVNNQNVFIGQFYLDTWQNKSETQIEFNCLDLLGILDTITYNGGLWTGTAIETVIEAILGPIFVPYDLDANLYGIQIKGWIPIGSYREALQHIAFAVGAYLDCSRSGSIKIYKTPVLATGTPSSHISKADKGISESLALKPLVTGVEVAAHNYVSVSTSKQVFNESLAVGTFTISFSEPLHNLSAAGATITDSGVNYAVLDVSSPGTVTLSGQVYLDTTQLFSVYTAGLSNTIKPNVLKITDATLINGDNGAEAVQRIYDYNQQRYLQKLKMYAPLIQVGDIVSVETLYNQTLIAVIEKMNIDLFGGMVAQVEMTGIVQ